MSRSKIFRLAIINLSLVGFFQINTCLAQLSSKHWIPAISERVFLDEAFLTLSTPEVNPISVEITDGGGTPISGSPFIISNADPLIIPMSDGPLYVSDSELQSVQSGKGLILTSDSKFYTSYSVRNNIHAEIITTKGLSAQGTEFRLGSVESSPSTSFNRAFYASVMATEDDTQITISQYDPGVVFYGDVLSTANIITETLNKGDTYTVLGRNVDAIENGFGFIGALVESSRPVVVNSGNTVGGWNNGTQDINLDQIAPIEFAGNQYAFLRGNGDDSMENPMIIAHYDNTNVFVNGSSTPANATPLNEGDYFIIPDSFFQGTNHENIYVETSELVFAYQFLAADSPATGGMNFLPAITCGNFNVVDNIVDVDVIGSVTYEAEIFVITSTSGILEINGSFIDPNIFAEPLLGNPDYVTYKVPGQTGNLVVECTEQINVGIFGFNGAQGFSGFFSGINEPYFAENDVEVCENVDVDLLTLIQGTVEPGGLWQPPLASGTNIFNSSNDPPGVYQYFQSGECEVFSLEATVSVLPSPTLDNIIDQDVCDVFVFPPITGNNLSGNEAYYSEINAGGTVYQPGDTYTVAGFATLYIFDILSNSPFCFDQQSFTVNLTETPEFDLSPDFSLCEGLTGTIEVTPINFDAATVNYSWTLDTDPLPFNTNVISITVPGTYQVFVERNGCISSTESCTVTLLPIPDLVVTPTSETICSGEETNIQLSSGLSGTTFDWTVVQTDVSGATSGSGTQITDVLTTTGAGNGLAVYTVTPTNNGCIGPSIDVVITVTSLAELFDVTNNSPICAGEPAEFDIEATPNSLIEYQLNGGAIETLTTDASGNAQVLFPNAESDVTLLLNSIENADCLLGLSQSYVVAVEMMPSLSSVDFETSVCEGEDVLFSLTGTSNSEVSYSINNGAIEILVLDAFGAGLITVANALENVELSITKITNSFCELILTSTYLVEVTPSPSISNLDNNSPLCEGEEGVFEIIGTPNAQVTYNLNNGTEQTLLLDNIGLGEISVLADTIPVTLTITKIELLDCSIELALVSIIDVIVPPVLEPIDDLLLCEAYTLPALSTGDYFTGPQGTGDILNPGDIINASKLIYVYAEADEAPFCSSEISFFIEFEAPLLLLEGTCNNGTYVISASVINTSGTVSFQWFDANGNLLDETSNEHQLDADGTYTCIAEITLGEQLCSIESVPFEAINTQCLLQRGISPNSDGVNDTFDLSDLDVESLTIFNRYGLNLYSRTNYVNEWGGQTDDGEQIPTGTYFYVIKTNEDRELSGWIYINR